MSRSSNTDWRPRFLDALAERGVVRWACEAAGVPRRTVYAERERNPDFAEAWEVAKDEAVETMELEVRRRAIEGVVRDVRYEGEVVGHERHYSDTLLIFALKAARPEVYRDNARIEHTGADGGPITFASLADLASVVDAEAHALLD